MRLRLVGMMVVGCIVAIASRNLATAQTTYYFVPTGADNYNNDFNWLEPNLGAMFVPIGSINELAVVDSGGTAQVSDTPPEPGAIAIGSTRGTAPPTVSGVGTLEVLSGGVLNVVMGTVAQANGSISVGTAGTGTLRIRSGGTVTSAGPLTLGPNAADTLVVGEASGAQPATLTPASAVLNGTTQVFPNAAFTTSGNGNLVFGATSTYTSEVNTSGTGRISAGGGIVLNGTARLNFTGVTPTVGGASYTILEADQYAGSFSNVTSNVTVPFNQRFVPLTVNSSPGRQQIRVRLEEVLVLEVNRDDGTVRITNPGAGGVALDSYYIASAAGSLVPGNFSGFTDNGLFGGNWIETSLAANNIAELKPTQQATVPASNNTPLGAIFNPFSGGFAGASEEDLQLVHSRFSDGAVIPAVVRYSGTRVNNLLLQVDPAGVGDAWLRNTSQTTVEIDSYHILSAGGRLSTSGWNSLDEQNSQGAGVWLEATNNGTGQLAEFNGSLSSPYLTLAPGAAINLGPLYTGTTPAHQDLVFQFTRNGGPANGDTGVVLYELYNPVAPVAGDYNGDGTVDAGDYVRWRNNLGDPTEADINNNGDGGGVTISDYAYWKARYGNPGSGGGSLTNAGQVPEPASWLIGLLVGMVGWMLRRSG